MKLKLNLLSLLIFLALVCNAIQIQAQDNIETILFTNVKVFNGVDTQLLNSDVLVKGNLIERVAKGIKAFESFSM